MRHSQNSPISAPRAIVLQVLLALLLLIYSSPASAQSLDEVAEEVSATGRFVEFEVDADLEASIERANAAGIAFVWLDQSNDDAQQIAESVGSKLIDMGSKYGSIVVLNNSGVWVASRGSNDAAAGNQAQELFAVGNRSGGLDLVTDVLSGQLSTTATTTGNSSGTSPTAASSAGFGILPLLLLGGLAFFAFRYFAGKRRKKKLLETNMASDVAEIREQLKDNADRVIELGDRVIVSSNDELIRMYEKASGSYQEVSQSIDGADTPQEVDRLDDAIDQAEWQFEVIEARLDGRPEPKSPADLPPPPGPQQTQPAAPDGDDRTSVTRRAPRTGSAVPPLGSSEQAQRRRAQPRRSRGGGGMSRLLTGGLGRMAMSMVMSLLMGGLGRGQVSRRSQRRGGFGGGGFGGGLGGGVLKGR